MGLLKGEKYTDGLIHVDSWCTHRSLGPTIPDKIFTKFRNICSMETQWTLFHKK